MSKRSHGSDDYRAIRIGESIEEAANRIAKVGDKVTLSDLKDMCRRFGLEWNLVSSRNGKKNILEPC